MSAPMPKPPDTMTAQAFVARARLKLLLGELREVIQAQETSPKDAGREVVGKDGPTR